MINHKKWLIWHLRLCLQVWRWCWPMRVEMLQWQCCSGSDQCSTVSGHHIRPESPDNWAHCSSLSVSRVARESSSALYHWSGPAPLWWVVGWCRLRTMFVDQISMEMLPGWAGGEQWQGGVSGGHQDWSDSGGQDLGQRQESRTQLWQASAGTKQLKCRLVLSMSLNIVNLLSSSTF